MANVKIEVHYEYDIPEEYADFLRKSWAAGDFDCMARFIDAMARVFLTKKQRLMINGTKYYY